MLTIYGHVTSSFAAYSLLVNLNRPSIWHGCWYWGHDLDLLGSRDVIGEMTSGWAMYGFLQVVLWNHRSISHRCWDIMCQTLSQAYSLWKCIDPNFCVLGGKIGGYSIFQLCACSRSLATSFELLTAAVSPWALLLQCLDLPIENALRGWKIGQNTVGEGVIGFWPPNKRVLTFWATFHQNWIKCATVGAQTDRQTVGQTDREDL